MMAYCTVDEVKNRLTEQYQERLSNIEQISPAIIYADAVIDCYLDTCYTIAELTSAQPIVKQLSIRLALAEIFRLIYQDEGKDLPDSVTALESCALSLLSKIQLGRANVPGLTRI